ncbi:hypothetical protein GNI_081880 [Gregarina niphandrodes]|uniref:Uncharacterized protein n=1 Tax=Gregarina niphandrodes TaxID=110365 RepID=A0A023B699_GRENI|nr:hypothetical protein GNI_081880 [Gregarina niphandrodes]EZG65887.1 hypothetical protein GNI_081880 [Gregarina niphandrodes]|eukprot:XP_011134045.1 hypothetical protein GNI_081880 [Gregarina niphandrodes]
MRGPVTSIVGPNTVFAALATTVIMSHGLFGRNKDDEEVYVVDKDEIIGVQKEAVWKKRNMAKDLKTAWTFKAHPVTVTQLRDAYCAGKGNVLNINVGAAVQLRKLDVSADSRRRVCHYWQCWNGSKVEELFGGRHGRAWQMGTDETREVEFNFDVKGEAVLILEKRRDTVSREEHRRLKKSKQTQSQEPSQVASVRLPLGERRNPFLSK